jgi:hypothetical protein
LFAPAPVVITNKGTSNIRGGMKGVFNFLLNFNYHKDSE